MKKESHTQPHIRTPVCHKCMSSSFLSTPPQHQQTNKQNHCGRQSLTAVSNLQEKKEMWCHMWAKFSLVFFSSFLDLRKVFFFTRLRFQLLLPLFLSSCPQFSSRGFLSVPLFRHVVICFRTVLLFCVVLLPRLLLFPKSMLSLIWNLDRKCISAPSARAMFSVHLPHTRPTVVFLCPRDKHLY